MISLYRMRTRTAIALLVATGAAGAQQPATTTGTLQPNSVRPPTIALVQPTGTGTVPRDKPIIVFRFAPGESDDPIDARSFTVAVDGADRSARFHVTANEAWGPLSGVATDDSLPATGLHAVSARICSVRGLCGRAEVTVAVGAGAVTNGTPHPPGPGLEKPPSSRARLIARVLEAVRKIFVP